MANKKINQLVLKTTIQPTDLFPLGDATTGQLFKKTVAELQAAIGGAVISVNGLVGTVVLDTDDIQELASPTNRYFTEARARAAISLTTTGSSGASTYSSSTGVLNVPNYTLAGLGGITASFLSGGTGITYNSSTGVISYSGTVYTDASIRALFSAGTGINYNSSTGAISYSGTVYTDSSIRALISLTTNGSSGSSTYNNTTGVLNVPTYTLAGLGGISSTFLSAGTGITYNSTTGVISYSGTVYTDSSVRGLFSATSPIIYNSSTGAIGITQASGSTNGFLSSIDWTTFNNKQNAITLTTTGTSGSATFSGGTLNIPQYQGVLTNPVTGTGTAGHVAYWSGSGTITGESALFYNSTSDRLGIGTASPNRTLEVSTGSDTYSRISGNRGNADAVPVGVLEFFNSNTSILVGEIRGMTGTGGTQSNSGQLAFYTNDAGTYAERMRISSTGATTIFGKTNISKNIDDYALTIVNTNTSGYGMYIQAGSSNNAVDIFNSSGSTQLFVIKGNGNVGINTSSPVNPLGYGLTIEGSSYAPLYLTNSGTTRGYFVGYSGGLIINASSGTLALNNGGSNVLIGTTTDNGERLYVSGSIRATGSITANSDARLKKNIERIENALEKVEQISGYTYNTIYDEDRHAGVIAQEIDKVLPEIVNKGNDGLMGVEYGNISALLIEAIKEQKVLIESLQAKVEALSK